MAVHDLQRLLDRRVSSGCVRSHHGAVQVRPPGPGLAEEAHRAVRVELPRFTERTRREGWFEGVQELDALVEVQLRFCRARSDLTRKGPESPPEGSSGPFSCAAVVAGMSKQIMAANGKHRRMA